MTEQDEKMLEALVVDLRVAALPTKPDVVSLCGPLAGLVADVIDAALSPAVDAVAWQRLHPMSGWIACAREDLAHYEAMGQRTRALRPTQFEPGVCRCCGCVDERACMTEGRPCAWADVAHTLCTACVPPPPVDDARKATGDVRHLLIDATFEQLITALAARAQADVAAALAGPTRERG